jgi:hypothetical protein
LFLAVQLVRTTLNLERNVDAARRLREHLVSLGADPAALSIPRTDEEARTAALLSARNANEYASSSLPSTDGARGRSRAWRRRTPYYAARTAPTRETSGRARAEAPRGDP